ncbi:MAG TPA: hypothetical protein VEJ18_01335, partial [Planctomycetota bacterium]|nr:hypothetical protein [Planctomycetota bacterium]
VQTLKATLCSLALTAAGTSAGGVLGAAAAFALSYAIYLYWVARAARDAEASLTGTMRVDQWTVILGGAALACAGGVAWLLGR